MSALSTIPTKPNGPLERAAGGATGQKHDLDITREKTLATIRAKLYLAGMQRLHVAVDGVFYVATPFGQVMRFDNLASLQARADEVRV